MLEPLALNSQHHDHIRALDSLVDGEARHAVRHQLGWTGKPHFRTEAGQELRGRSGYPAISDVAADCGRKSFDSAEMTVDRSGVEQGLRWMLIGPVARVDHRRVHDQRD